MNGLTRFPLSPVPTVPSLSSFSPPGGRFSAPATVPRVVAAGPLAGSHVVMATVAVPLPDPFPPPPCSSSSDQPPPNPISSISDLPHSNPVLVNPLPNLPVPSLSGHASASISAPTAFSRAADTPPPPDQFPPPPSARPLPALSTLPNPDPQPHNPTSSSYLPSSDLASRSLPAPDLPAVAAPSGPSAAPSSSAPPLLPQPPPPCQPSSLSIRSSSKLPAALPTRAPSKSNHPHPHPSPSAVPSPSSQQETSPQSVLQGAAAQPAHLSAAGPQQSVPPAQFRAAAPLSSTADPHPPAASSSDVAAPLSSPATLVPPTSSVPRQQSYAQVVRPSRGPGFVRSHARDVESFARLPRTGANIICGSKEGMPSFSFVNSELPMVEELYVNALVMKFHGGRPSLEASHKEIQTWGIEHPFSIGPLSSRAFLLRFQDHVDLLKVLTRQSSLLITFPYKVYRWHNLCHTKEDSCFAPIWISLPRLPLQCFIPEFLESVANKIGRFLCLDKATSTLARPSAARICVEIDLRRTPHLSFGLACSKDSDNKSYMKDIPNIATNAIL